MMQLAGRLSATSELRAVHRGQSIARRRRHLPRRAALLKEPRTLKPVPPMEQHSGSREALARDCDGSSSKQSADNAATDRRQQLLLAKAYNFLAGSQGVFVYPYLSLFLAQHGMSPSQIGLLSLLRPFAAAATSLAASAAADRWRCHQQLLLGAAAVSVALRSSLPLAGDATLLLAGMLLAAEAAGGPVNVLADATVLSNCAQGAGDYGQVRVAASWGFGLASMPAGWLIARTGLHTGFAAYTALALPMLLCLCGMCYQYADAGAADGAAASDKQQQQQQQATAAGVAADGLSQPLSDDKQQQQQAGESASRSSGGGSSLLEVLRQPRCAVFLWRCLLMGFAMGVMANFEYLWLARLGGPETLIGAAIAVSICTEVPAFSMQGVIQSRMSASGLLNIVLAATVLRLGCYALLPLAGSPWAVLPVELLHGITFGVGWSTAVTTASKLAPQHLSATMMGLFQAAYGGVGAGLGGLIGGLLLERHGGQGLFAAAAGLLAAGALLRALAERATCQAAAAVAKEQ